MTETEAWTLFFVLLPAVGAVIGIIPIYNQVKKDANRYRFYAFRDDLIYLVAKKKLSEDDYLFTEFYTMVNRIVNLTHKITFSNLVKAIRADLADKGATDKMRSALRKADPEVKEAIGNYLDAVLQTMHSNSIVFRVLVQVLGFSAICYNCARAIKRFIPARFKEAYQIERNVNNLVGVH